MCVCVCVCERERERESKKERGREPYNIYVSLLDHLLTMLK